MIAQPGDGPSDEQVQLQGLLMTSILNDLAHDERGPSPTTKGLLRLTITGTLEAAWTLQGFALSAAVPIRQAVLNGSVHDYPFFDLDAGVAAPPDAVPQLWDTANTLVVHAANGRMQALHDAITDIVNSAVRADDKTVDGTYFCDLAVTLVVISGVLLTAGCEWPEPSPELQAQLWEVTS